MIVVAVVALLRACVPVVIWKWWSVGVADADLDMDGWTVWRWVGCCRRLREHNSLLVFVASIAALWRVRVARLAFVRNLQTIVTVRDRQTSV